MNNRLEVLLNVGLRGATLISKFALLFFLAKYAEPEDVGVYGLISVTIGYLLYFLGVDYYTYSTREMLSVDRGKWPEILRNQAVFHVLVYLVVLPFVSIVFITEILSLKYLIPFYLLLISEHIAQELNRILIAAGRVLTASVVLFLRSGLWCYIAIGLIYFKVYEDNLIVTLSTWIVGSVAAAMIGIVALKDLSWKDIKGTSVDWSWIKKGLSVAGLFLIGTLCLRGIYTADRYIVNYLSGVAMVGVYTFYMAVCSAYTSFIDAAVISFRYAKMVEAYRRGDITQFLILRKGMQNAIIGIGVLIGIAAAVMINPVLSILDKSSYTNQIQFFWIMLASSGIVALSLVPHYSLYAFGKDRVLAVINVVGVLVFFTSTYTISIYYEGLTSVVFSILITSIYFLLFKQLFFRLFLNTLNIEVR
ncbi:hypothetical protein EOPP23_15035 [Endozoicomonas sp. OPT23]|uniref:lipopolysaccharide biosynthesis protein n=1 Tax=Endozoicomonas sp. OPT23 TaxID=2072845 RepID=UPI0018915992|nr:hypothetical protein [Endozoicomonas sp. OPT23]MRI34303.1 hypothetical protein [Endozoicomonas sp. OPT23]